MKYLVLFDDGGKRITSLVAGINFPSWDTLEADEIKRFKRDFNATYSLELEEDIHNALLKNNLYYEDGELVDKLPNEVKSSEIVKDINHQKEDLRELSKENREDILKEILLRLDELEDKEEE